MSQLTKIAPNSPSLSISSVNIVWGGCKERTEKRKLYLSFLRWKYWFCSAFILFVEPFEFEPTLSFIALKDVPSQDPDGIKSAIMKAFDDTGMPELKDRMVLSASDGASVNIGIKTGLATKFRVEDIDWPVFVWCLSHRLELALKIVLMTSRSQSKKKLNQLVIFVPQILKEIKRIT